MTGPRDPRIVEAAAKAAAFNDGKNGFANAGKINGYRCTDASFSKRGGGCGRVTVTIDREPGVTPFLTQCPACGGVAQSACYRIVAPAEPTHEWYRPDQLEGLPPHTVDHVLKGGLILRSIADAKLERQLHEAKVRAGG